MLLFKRTLSNKVLLYVSNGTRLQIVTAGKLVGDSDSIVNETLTG